MASKKSDDQPRKARPRRRWVRRFLLAVIWVSVVGGATVIVLLRSTPEDYKQFQAFLETHTEQQIADIAVNVENKFSSLLAIGGDSPAGTQGGSITGADPSVDGAVDLETAAPEVLFGPRDLLITRNEANAWLTNKLPGWIESRGTSFPPQVSDIMASTEGNHIVIRFNFQTKEISQIVSMVMDTKFQSDGKVLLTLQSIRGGQLPLPLETLTGALTKTVDANSRVAEAVEKMTKMFDGETFDTRFNLDKKRDLTVVGVEFVKETINLKMNLVPRKTTAVAAVATP